MWLRGSSLIPASHPPPPVSLRKLSCGIPSWLINEFNIIYENPKKRRTSEKKRRTIKNRYPFLSWMRKRTYIHTFWNALTHRKSIHCIFKGRIWSTDKFHLGMSTLFFTTLKLNNHSNLLPNMPPPNYNHQFFMMILFISFLNIGYCLIQFDLHQPIPIRKSFQFPSFFSISRVKLNNSNVPRVVGFQGQGNCATQFVRGVCVSRDISLKYSPLQQGYLIIDIVRNS